MRFEDTLEGWQEQIEKIKKQSNLMTFIRAISKEEMLVVKVRKSGTSGHQPQAMCHANVANFVTEHGGRQHFGWMLRPWELYDDNQYDGMFLAVFHSNWMSPEGQLVSITPEDNNFHIFLPDLNRKFNFSTQESYNNRVTYTEEYKPPYNAVNPARNVTYFFAAGFADRSKQFEKYRIPKSMTDIENEIPESMKRKINGRLQLTSEGEKWAKLKFSVSSK
jgi:hypothetical protein